MAVFAAGWFAYALPFMVGNALGSGLVALGPGTAPTMALIVWALLVVTLVVLDESSPGNRLIFTELNDEGDEDTLARRAGGVQLALDEKAVVEEGYEAVDPLRGRCDAVARDYGLTAREREILELLARGRSKAHIAEAFFIPENTVCGHVKHIYAKLDAHGKQELLDKVEGQA